MGYYHNHSKENTLYIASLISQEGLDKLFDFLKDEFNKIEIYGVTKDKSELLFKEYKDLLAYNNFKGRELKTLKIICKSNDKYLTIHFDDKRYFIKPETIRYKFEYNDYESGFLLDDKLINHLIEFKPSFNLMRYANAQIFLSTIGIITLLLAFSLKLFFNYNFFYNFDDPLHQINLNVLSVLIILTLGFWFIVCYTLDRSRDYLFPLIFISLGNQMKEYQKRKKIRNFIFITIVFTVILGILINWISAHILQ